MEKDKTFWNYELCFLQTISIKSKGKLPLGNVINNAFYNKAKNISAFLPTDETGKIVIPSNINEQALQILPTEESGKFIYPIVNDLGELLQKDIYGRYKLL